MTASGDGADPAEHSGSKCLDARHGAGGGGEGGIGGAQQHTGDGRQGRADGKGHGDGAVDVDAHDWAAALSSEQARMALPILVRPVKAVRASMMAPAVRTPG